jgi:hypothetical protein
VFVSRQQWFPVKYIGEYRCTLLVLIAGDGLRLTCRQVVFIHVVAVKKEDWIPGIAKGQLPDTSLRSMRSEA